MYKKNIYTVVSNKNITANIYEMILSGDTQYIVKPGQFINIAVEGFYLRRPLSVCFKTENAFTVIYKVVGGGTEKMSMMSSGVKLDVLTGLGNGFDTSLSGNKPLLIGGGAGVPPMYYLAETLIREGRKVTVIEGFNSKNEIFYENEFKSLGAEVIITTVDGSYGVKGFVTDAFIEDYSYFYTCGPEPMLKAVYDKTATSGQFSFEERMGCGFGACMGCTCKTKYGNKRICKDGPVLLKEEIVW